MLVPLRTNLGHHVYLVFVIVLVAALEHALALHSQARPVADSSR
jgi:hypothetical protein